MQRPPASDWERLKTAFDALADLPPAAREPALAALAVPAPLLGELRSLLAGHDRASAAPGVLDAGAVQALAPAATGPAEGAAAPAAGRPGERLGAWELLHLLGEGGMGSVWAARRADGQYEGRAAVKRIKPGMDSAAVLARFAQERQALARLAHPHIARLLDAGVDADGRPYFVMEQVDGRPLPAALPGLLLRARLALFLQLVDAVAHAHRQRLVHRDLKPANVLVDAEGRVKLLDFGIAKALQATGPDAAAHGRAEHPEGVAADGAADAGAAATTLFGGRAHTPHYASPEQLRGEPVGPPSDVYSLGVILYEMLTGIRPTGHGATTVQEATRSALEDEPTPPSRLARAAVPDPLWTRHRRALAGDLDHVVLKALEKSPARRYASAEALAADVQGVLDGQPVSARAPGARDRLLRALHRHRAALPALALGGFGLALGGAAWAVQGGALGAAGAAGLAGGLALALAQARRAAAARDAAQGHVAELRRLCREVVLQYGDAVTELPGGQRRQAALLASTLGYLERLLAAAGPAPTSGVGEAGGAGGANGAPARLELAGELAVLHARLAHLHAAGQFNAQEDAALTALHAGRALALFAEAEAGLALTAAAWERWALALLDLALQAQRAGDVAAGLAHAAQADAVLLRGLALHPRHAALVRARGDVACFTAQLHFGWERPDRGDLDAALQALDTALAHYAALVRGPESPETTQALFQCGTVWSSRALLHARRRDFAAAAPQAREAVAWRERAVAREPHNRRLQGGLAADRNLLAGLCLDLGDAAAGLQASSAGWSALERLLREDAGHAAWAQQRGWLAFHHGRALLGCGDAGAARPVLQVSADFLQGEIDAGRGTPRQRERLAQTQAALARALA